MYPFPNFEPGHHSMSASNCFFLRPAYRILRRQGKWSGIPFSLRIFQFVVIHTVKGFSIVSEAEVDVLLELLLFLWSNRCWQFDLCFLCLCYISSLSIWKFSVHVLLKPNLEDFEHHFASVWNECNCVIVWTFFGIALPWDWNENWPFPVL